MPYFIEASPRPRRKTRVRWKRVTAEAYTFREPAEDVAENPLCFCKSELGELVDEIVRLRAELAAERKAPAGHTIPCAMGYHQNCGCACVCHTNSLPEPAQ